MTASHGSRGETRVLVQPSITWQMTQLDDSSCEMDGHHGIRKMTTNKGRIKEKDRM